MTKSKVAVLKTDPVNIFQDYQRLMNLAGYTGVISSKRETLLKLNLSWSLFYPACSTPPWQLDAVIGALVEDGFSRDRIHPVENKTVVTNTQIGAEKNRWNPVFKKHGISFTPLTDVQWTVFKPKRKFLILDRLYPEGVEIPEMFIGKDVIHLPTMKTHGHSVMTGAVKNSFGGLLKTVRHYCHKYIHEALVDLLILQREIHPGVFAVMDATVCGDGAGPRCMEPKVKNYILASSDSVALDAVAAKMMGMDPLKIPFINLANGIGLGVGDPSRIEIVGSDIEGINFNFRTKRSFVIWGDQFIRKGPLRFFEKLLLHTPASIWAAIASTVYHDYLWYPLVGSKYLREFYKTEWGRLFKEY